MKRIINFNLPLRFCVLYHKVIMVIHLVAGVVLTMAVTIHDKGVSQGIMLGIATLVMGTLCFLVLPMLFLVGAIFSRFAPIIGVPVYLIMCIGNLCGETNDLSYPLLYVFASIWGWFNIRTAIIANENEDFSVLTFFRG